MTYNHLENKLIISSLFSSLLFKFLQAALDLVVKVFISINELAFLSGFDIVLVLHFKIAAYELYVLIY
jgi:hypothetical protein